MPGPLMTTQRAAKIYPGPKKVGNNIRLRNSTGKMIEVSKNTKVYHRGNGRFAVYSQSLDAKRKGKLRKINQLPPKKRNTHVGFGKYRHTHDGKTG